MPRIMLGDLIPNRHESWHDESDYEAWHEEWNFHLKDKRSKLHYLPKPHEIEAAAAALREEADRQYEEWWDEIPIEHTSRSNCHHAKVQRMKRDDIIKVYRCKMSSGRDVIGYD